MQRFLIIPALGILLVLAACGAPEETPTPVVVPTSIALAGVRSPHIETEDGNQLSLSIYGAGTTAVVISTALNEGKVQWTSVAQRLADQGYLVVTYNHRVYFSSVTDEDREKLISDLHAVVDYTRQQGATHIVLLGASLGGMLTAKVAATNPPDAVIIMSTPTSSRGLEVSDAELQAISAPKLFIASADEPYAAGTQHMFAVAPEPKEQEIYPGEAIGNNIFLQHREELMGRILTFLKTHAPPG